MSRKNKLSVFSYIWEGYSKKYLFTHPWILAKEYCAALKNVWQRAVKGYCRADLWDFDVYGLELLCSALKTFIKDTNGFPDDIFETYEDYIDYLTSIANRLDEYLEFQSRTYDDENENPYSCEYQKINKHQLERFLETINDPEASTAQEIRKNYLIKHDELWNKYRKLLIETMTDLSKVWDTLWW